MVHKRFWTIAIGVVTIAVAGAGVLPSLLLAPAAQPEPLIAVASSAAVGTKPVKPTVPVQVVIVPPAPVEATSAPTPPAALPVTPPAPEPVKAPEPAKPPEPATEVAASAFPPVQPVGIPAKPAEVAAAPAATPAPSTATNEATREAEKAKRGTRSQRLAERPRRVRPAPYPMREFLAWRR